MEFTKEDFVSNIYETSKSQAGKALMEPHEKGVPVYGFDQVKKWFCDTYRNEKNMRSCDAYYQDADKNYLMVEFKNTHHFTMRSFMPEIEEKMIDSHMLLAETFWRNRKVSDIRKKVRILLVYHDGAKDYGEGVRGISNALNAMKPLKGDTARSSKSKVYNSEEEYLQAVEALREKYKASFFAEIEFIEKKNFYDDYIKTGYFKVLD